MKLLGSAVLFFFTVCCFSQSEITLTGYIISDKLPASGIEVINLNTEKSAVSNSNGQFQIIAKVADVLIFYSKKHEYKKVVLKAENLKEETFIVSVLRKPEELEEVIITKMPSIKLGLDKGYEQGKIDELTLKKAASTPKVLGVNNGTIENGIDLWRIGGMIIGLFLKDKEPTKVSAPAIDFKTYAKATCEDAFYIENLHLKPEEINLFLEFCDADSGSKAVFVNANRLTLMDFLFKKSIAFKELTSASK